jgi:spore coat polysaccharide biosynthesis predicted glycosyltransferase SpsG
MEDAGAKKLTLLRDNAPCGSLVIRTAAGPSIGFGHLRRSLILAGHLRRSATPIFLLDSDDTWSRDQVCANGMLSLPFNPRNPLCKIEEPSLLLIDSRKMAGLRPLIAHARARNIPIASIHDLGLDPLPSDIVIDGSILPARNGFDGENAAFYTGPAFCVLDDDCRQHRRAAGEARRHIRRVVINLGGGDGREFFCKALEGLRATGLALQVTGLPGFCAWGQEALAHKSWDPLQFSWLSKEGDAFRLMADADLILSAGGRSAYEAMCIGTPLCALSYDRHQARTLSALARAGACLDLGPGPRLEASIVAEKVLELDADPIRREQLSRSGRRLVDGDGACRVAEILRAAIRRTISGRPEIARSIEKSETARSEGAALSTPGGR